MARPALPFRRRWLGPRLSSPCLVRGRWFSTPPRHPHQRRADYLYIRESADWLPHALAQQSVDETLLAAAFSPEALAIRAQLVQRGACFANDLQRIAGLTRQQVGATRLWELATAGLAAADGFDQLRALMDPRRKATTAESAAKRQARTTAGRWSLLVEPLRAGCPILCGFIAKGGSQDARSASKQEARAAAIAHARRTDAALESFARMLLARYGILFRDLLTRESNAPKWRDLLGILRRLEARGEVRGGRFVTGFGGEQFALPEAVDSLRAARNRESADLIAVAAADPLNLAGIILPGERIAAVPGREVRYRNGSLAAEDVAAHEAAVPTAPRRNRFVPAVLPHIPEPVPPAPTLF